MYCQKTLGFETKFQLHWKTEQNYQSWNLLPRCIEKLTVLSVNLKNLGSNLKCLYYDNVKYVFQMSVINTNYIGTSSGMSFNRKR